MSIKVCVFHGPNLNLLGSRESAVYGSKTSEHILNELRTAFPQVHIDYLRSNSEHELVDAVQKAGQTYAGFIINAGAYAHTSIALADAIRAVNMPCISVHISHIYNREAYRHNDPVGEACKGSIVGLGTDGYALALDCLLDLIRPEP